MSRMKTLTREENRKAVANLVDLGFTVQAIAFMTKKSEQNIYILLERMGRKKGGVIDRHDPETMDANAYRYVQRLFSEAQVVLPHVWGAARTMATLAKKNGKSS